MTNLEFVEKAKWITTLKTIYAVGGFGASCVTKNKTRYGDKAQNKDYKDKIYSADGNTFLFDCLGLEKGILWGFNATPNATYGGATYTSNGVPDYGISAIPKWEGFTNDLSNVEVGGILYMKGHTGIYVGDNLVVESCPAWKCGVQITALKPQSGYHRNLWTGWARCPYIEYVEPKKEETLISELTITRTEKVYKVNAININGENFVRLRDFEDVLHLADIEWSAEKGVTIE